MVRRKSKGIFWNIQAGKRRISLGIVCNKKRSLEKKKLRRRDEVCAQRRREKREGKKERGGGGACVVLGRRGILENRGTKREVQLQVPKLELFRFGSAVRER
jgi:hypothetical protein